MSFDGEKTGLTKFIKRCLIISKRRLEFCYLSMITASLYIQRLGRDVHSLIDGRSHAAINNSPYHPQSHWITISLNGPNYVNPIPIATNMTAGIWSIVNSSYKTCVSLTPFIPTHNYIII